MTQKVQLAHKILGAAFLGMLVNVLLLNVLLLAIRRRFTRTLAQEL